MALTFDTATYTIESTASITDLPALHQELRDWEDSEQGAIHPVTHSWKALDLGSGGFFYQADLLSPWVLKFPNAGNYTISGNLKGTITPVAGVYVERKTSAAYITTSVGGSGPSAESIAAAVWGYSPRALTSGGAGGSAPTAAENAAAVRTELSTELGRIDTTVSSRMAAASYVAPDNTPVLAAIGGIPTNPVLASDARLNNLDAPMSSRLAAAAYVAPETAASIAAAVGARNVEGDISLDELLRVALAVLAGRSSGTGTSTEQYLSQAGTPRVTATFDDDGNRTSVVLNGA